MTKIWNSCPKNLRIGPRFQGFLLNWLEICSKCVLEINVFWGFCYASKLALETLWKTRSLAFWKSVNNGRSSKFSLASKQHKKRFETHLFSSLVYYCQTRPSVEINGAHSIKMFSQKITCESKAKTSPLIACKLCVDRGLQKSFTSLVTAGSNGGLAGYEAWAKVFSRRTPFISGLHFHRETHRTINHRYDTSWKLQSISGFRREFDVPCLIINSFALSCC